MLLTFYYKIFVCHLKYYLNRREINGMRISQFEQGSYKLQVTQRNKSGLLIWIQVSMPKLFMKIKWGAFSPWSSNAEFGQNDYR